MIRVSVVNMAWQLPGNAELIAQACADADVVLVCEALRRVDGANQMEPLAPLLPEGWVANQEHTQHGKARGQVAVCWRESSMQLVATMPLHRLSRGTSVAPGSPDRWLSAATLRHLGSGDTRPYAACHAPVERTGKQPEFYRALDAWSDAHPTAVVGADTNRAPAKAAARVGRPFIGREVMTLLLPTDLEVAGERYDRVRTSDHPIVRATLRTPSKEKPVAQYRFEKRPSPNHSTRQHYGYPSEPTGITIHHWGAPGQTHDAVVAYLCRTGGDTSAHEVISAGRVTQLVEHDRAAWHAGSTAGNGSTIGLECRPEMSDADWQTLVQRCADIEEIHGSMRYYRHSDWKATACPGKYGPRLGELIKAVNAEHARRAGARPLPETGLSRRRADLAAWRKRLGARRPRVRAAIDAFLKGTPKR